MLNFTIYLLHLFLYILEYERPVNVIIIGFMVYEASICAVAFKVAQCDSWCTCAAPLYGMFYVWYMWFSYVYAICICSMH